MKVALDARYGLMRERRGIGVYIYHLLEEWRQNTPDGVTFTLFADARADPALVARFRGSSMDVQVLPARPFVIWEQWALPRAALSANADVLHATANVAPLWPSAKLVMTVFDVIEWHRGRDFPGDLPFRHRLSRLYRMNVLQWNVQRAHAILTISDHAATDIARTLHVPTDKLTIAPLGYSTRPVQADPSILGEVAVTPRQYAMAFGALDSRKNVAMLLDLWATHSMPCPLVAVGFEPSALAQAKGRYGRVPDLRLLPFQSDARVRSLLENAAMFLYPSFYEGFGLPVLEAMAAGAPVIVSRGTASEEIARGGALAVPAHDSEAWELAIRNLWHDTAAQETMRREGPRIAASYTWSGTAEAVMHVYRGVTGEGSQTA